MICLFYIFKRGVDHSQVAFIQALFENSAGEVEDAIFREDANKTNNKTVSQNPNIIRKWCLSILKMTELS